MSLVKGVDLEISGVAFQAAHPELHHYTNAAGLKGIVSTNTIWATHFRDLNDLTEVTHLRQSFADALAPRYDEAISRQTLSEEPRQLYEREGGSQKLARDFVDSLYGATFDVDGLDPAFAPGTGTPETGGLTPREAQQILHGLRGIDVVGGDVVEVAPQYDPSSNTAMVGAQMLFEIFSLMVLGRRFERRP